MIVNMIKNTKAIFVLVATLSLLVLFAPSGRTKAQVLSILTDRSFGGLVSSFIPCTCTGDIMINFSLLHTGIPGQVFPLPGSLLYRPGSLGLLESIPGVDMLSFVPGIGGFLGSDSTELFAHFRPAVPLTWEMGMYRPGGVCLVTCPTGCCPVGLPLGVMTKLGTGALGGI